jgi:hypothetical protein
MYNNALDTAQDLVESHKYSLQVMLNALGVTYEKAYEMFLRNSAELPEDVEKEIYYIDAYTRLINMVNYTPVDRADWRPKDYIDNVMPGLYAWAQTEEAQNLSNKYTDMPLVEGASNKEVFELVLQAAIYKRRGIDDRQEGQQSPALEGAASSELGTANGGEDQKT